ncbi:MAG: hypothetical protein Q7R98_01965 [Candidatus Jorgensenbacteria bacterium]|nr:hypothetical protein [Candidatus Jorgensenbacteria bacterium]
MGSTARKKFWIVLVLVALILIAAYLVFIKFTLERSYSVVYLATGETYVGKLSYFPRLYLTDGYRVDAVIDSGSALNKSNIQLVPLEKMMWAPSGLYINKYQVVFYGPLQSSSEIAELLNKQK